MINLVTSTHTTTKTILFDYGFGVTVSITHWTIFAIRRHPRKIQRNETHHPMMYCINKHDRISAGLNWNEIGGHVRWNIYLYVIYINIQIKWAMKFGLHSWHHKPNTQQYWRPNRKRHCRRSKGSRCCLLPEHSLYTVSRSENHSTCKRNTNIIGVLFKRIANIVNLHFM